MRKLICILNTMIARRQKWDANRYKMSDPARLPPVTGLSCHRRLTESLREA
jgi:hypothetical protein